MGERIRITCEKCKFDKDIFFGCGRLAAKIDVIKDMLSKNELSEFIRLEEQNKIKGFNWEYVIGYCQECKDVESVEKITCVTNDDEKIVFGNKCSKCEKKVQIISPEKEIECPLCGEGHLTSQFAGFWD